MLTSKSLSVEDESSWLLSQCRVGSDSLWVVQSGRRFRRYRVHATAPNLESSYAKEV